MSASQQPTPLAYRYAIEIDSLQVGQATEISTVSIEMKTADQWVATGDGALYLHSYPGPAEYGDITFKAVKVDNVTAMYDWLQAVVDGDFTKSLRNGTIVQLMPDKDISTHTGDRWNFEGAWPSKWELGSSGAGTSSLVIETLTLKPSRIWRD